MPDLYFYRDATDEEKITAALEAEGDETVAEEAATMAAAVPQAAIAGATNEEWEKKEQWDA